MKKTLILMAAASAFVLTGCTETDLSGDTSLAKESAPSAIEFSAKTRNAGATRATGGPTGDITTTTLQTGSHAEAGFGVMAYVKGTNGATDCYTTGNWNNEKPNFMYNQQVKYSTDHWTYTPVKFWPNDFSTTNVDAKQGEAGENYNATGSVNSGKVSFFAYAPFVAPADYTTKSTTHKLGGVGNTAFNVDNSGAATDGIVAMTANDYTGEPQVKYVLSKADLKNAVDLLWGVRGNTTGYKLANGETSTDGANAYNTDLTKQSVDETIDFLFKHALAKIGGHTYETSDQTGLQVILDLDNGSQNGSVSPSTAISGGVKEANTLVTVKDIKIRDLNTYDGATSSDLIKSGWFNIATGKWTENTEIGATYSHEVDNADVKGTEGWEMNAQIKEPTTTSAISYSTSENKWSDGSNTITGVLATTAQDVYATQSKAPGLVLIPSETQDQTLVVTVTYIVRTFDDHLAGNADGATGTWTKVEQTITNKVTIPKGSLESNKFYKLLMRLGLTSVKFAATVADWDEASSTSDNDDENSDKMIYLPSNTISTSTEVTAGTTSAAANVTKANQTFIINLTDATDANAYTATVSGADGATISPASGSFSGTSQEFVVSIPANTSSQRDITVTITDTTADPDKETTVTITQASGE